MGNYIRQRPATSKINPTSLNMICMNTKGKWRLRLPRFCDNTQQRPQNKKLLNALKLKRSQDAQFPDVSQRSLCSKLMFEIQAEFFVFGWIFNQKQCWLSEQPVCFSNNKAKRYEKKPNISLGNSERNCFENC